MLTKKYPAFILGNTVYFQLDFANKGMKVNCEDFEIPRYLLNVPFRSPRESHLRNSAVKSLALHHISFTGSAPLANTTTDEESDSSPAPSPYLPMKARARAPPPPPSPFNKSHVPMVHEDEKSGEP